MGKAIVCEKTTEEAQRHVEALMKKGHVVVIVASGPDGIAFAKAAAKMMAENPKKFGQIKLATMSPEIRAEFAAIMRTITPRK